MFISSIVTYLYDILSVSSESLSCCPYEKKQQPQQQQQQQQQQQPQQQQQQQQQQTYPKFNNLSSHFCSFCVFFRTFSKLHIHSNSSFICSLSGRKKAFIDPTKATVVIGIHEPSNNAPKTAGMKKGHSGLL